MLIVSAYSYGLKSEIGIIRPMGADYRAVPWKFFPFLILLMSMFLQARYQPFFSREDNVLEQVVLGMLMLVCTVRPPPPASKGAGGCRARGLQGQRVAGPEGSMFSGLYKADSLEFKRILN